MLDLNTKRHVSIHPGCCVISERHLSNLVHKDIGTGHENYT
jgi:hypothetical protein